MEYKISLFLTFIAVTIVVVSQVMAGHYLSALATLLLIAAIGYFILKSKRIKPYTRITLFIVNVNLVLIGYLVAINAF